MDRCCARRRFVFQFAVMAKPKKRQGGQRGGEGWKPRLWPLTRHTLELAASRHAEAQAKATAERAARTEQQGRAFVALAHVVADTGGGGWPESMTRELQACRSPQERNAWAVKWGAYLSGQVERDKRGAPERPAAGRAASGGHHPS